MKKSEDFYFDVLKNILGAPNVSQATENKIWQFFMYLSGDAQQNGCVNAVC